MKKYLIQFFGVVAIIMLFSLLVYPTPFQYAQFTVGNNSYPVVINRFTGDAKALIPGSGWVFIKHNDVYEQTQTLP